MPGAVGKCLPHVCPRYLARPLLRLRTNKNPPIRRAFVEWAILGSKEEIGVI